MAEPIEPKLKGKNPLGQKMVQPFSKAKKVLNGKIGDKVTLSSSKATKEVLYLPELQHKVT